MQAGGQDPIFMKWIFRGGKGVLLSNESECILILMTEKKNEKKWERTASPRDGGMRLDKFWGRELAEEGVSRGRVKSWIESGLALVDGEVVTKGKQKLMGYEVVSIGADVSSSDALPAAVAGDLTALYEDEHLLVVEKPAGVTTHPAPGESDPTLVNYLLHQWPDIASDSSGMDGQRPGIVHRLDKDTSGLIAVARTEGDRLALSADFAGRNVHKVYLAIVHGVPKQPKGTIEAPIGRHPTQKTRMAVIEKGGREAVSDYRVLWTGPRGLASLVAVRIHTGRTHQIRVHMAHIGHPLLGDATYGSRENAEWLRRTDSLAHCAPRQMLHAFYLSINHPKSGEKVTVWRQPPEDFRHLLAALSQECFRVGIVGMPGSGKSALLNFLREAGLAGFSADESVAELYGAGGDGAAMIQQRFGGVYTLSDGGVDKPALFEAMCQSERFRREVMDMIHPMVRHACEAFFKRHRDDAVSYAEIPLLLEGGWHENGSVDAVVGVRCAAEKRTGELRELRGLPIETLAVFDSWQWSEEKKLSACDLIVENCAGLDALQAEADRLRVWAEALATERNVAFAQRLEALWEELATQFEREGTAA